MAEEKKAQAPKEQAPKEQTLQDLFEELDHLIGDMEEGELSLEESFALYHKGMDTLKKCSEKIDTVEKKMVVLDEEGEEHEFE